jgi:hypothetical protein
VPGAGGEAASSPGSAGEKSSIANRVTLPTKPSRSDENFPEARLFALRRSRGCVHVQARSLSEPGKRSEENKVGAHGPARFYCLIELSGRHRGIFDLNQHELVGLLKARHQHVRQASAEIAGALGAVNDHGEEQDARFLLAPSHLGNAQDR